MHRKVDNRHYKSRPIDWQIFGKSNEQSAQELKAQIYRSANNPKIFASIGDAFHYGTNSDGQTGNGHARHFPFASRHADKPFRGANRHCAKPAIEDQSWGSILVVGEPTIRTIRQ